MTIKVICSEGNKESTITFKDGSIVIEAEKITLITPEESKG